MSHTQPTLTQKVFENMNAYRKSKGITYKEMEGNGDDFSHGTNINKRFKYSKDARLSTIEESARMLNGTLDVRFVPPIDQEFARFTLTGSQTAYDHIWCHLVFLWQKEVTHTIGCASTVDLISNHSRTISCLSLSEFLAKEISDYGYQDDKMFVSLPVKTITIDRYKDSGNRSGAAKDHFNFIID